MRKPFTVGMLGVESTLFVNTQPYLRPLALPCVYLDFRRLELWEQNIDGYRDAVIRLAQQFLFEQSLPGLKVYGPIGHELGAILAKGRPFVAEDLILETDDELRRLYDEAVQQIVSAPERSEVLLPDIVEKADVLIGELARREKIIQNTLEAIGAAGLRKYRAWAQSALEMLQSVGCTAWRDGPLGVGTAPTRSLTSNEAVMFAQAVRDLSLLEPTGIVVADTDRMGKVIGWHLPGPEPMPAETGEV